MNAHIYPDLPPVLLLAGPTASGKSALALAWATRHPARHPTAQYPKAWHPGVIINADSLQVYAGLAVLTAQPTAAEQAAVPHRLYGIRQPQDTGSVALWRAQALAAIAAAYAAGRQPIVVGGTGLYLKALLEGISPIPAVSPEIQAHVLALSPEACRARLMALDPMAAQEQEKVGLEGLAQKGIDLEGIDRQRLQRALMVLLQTGRPLRHWQAVPGTPCPFPVRRVLLLPERAVLYERINRRFVHMLRMGALDEVARVCAAGLSPDLPALKAVGVPELRAHLAGQLSLPEATALAQQHSRNYAKRQLTWFRHQMQWDEVREDSFTS
jgi:tRNA dimethylallyltransferase